MAKTLSQLIVDVRQIINQPDATNSQFTDAELTTWLNDAYINIVIALRCLPQSPNDYTVSSATVTLDSPTITIDRAKLKNPDNSGKYYELKIIKLAELLDMDADYENADSGLPQYLAWTGPVTGTLYPPPKASVVAQTTPLRTYGVELPTAMSAGTDTPSLLPEHIHQILPHYPAYRAFTMLGDVARATQQLTLFRGQVKDNKASATEFSRGLRKWRFQNRI